MLMLRTADQLRGARNLRGFRACAASTGVSLWRAEVYRLLRAEAGLATREVRRRWLARHWGARAARLHGSRSGAGGERDMVRHGATPMVEVDS